MHCASSSAKDRRSTSCPGPEDPTFGIEVDLIVYPRRGNPKPGLDPPIGSRNRIPPRCVRGRSGVARMVAPTLPPLFRGCPEDGFAAATSGCRRGGWLTSRGLPIWPWPRWSSDREARSRDRPWTDAKADTQVRGGQGEWADWTSTATTGSLSFVDRAWGRADQTPPARRSRQTTRRNDRELDSCTRTCDSTTATADHDEPAPDSPEGPYGHLKFQTGPAGCGGGGHRLSPPQSHALLNDELTVPSQALGCLRCFAGPAPGTQSIRNEIIGGRGRISGLRRA
jgi:hypothetical protein